MTCHQNNTHVLRISSMLMLALLKLTNESSQMRAQLMSRRKCCDACAFKAQAKALPSMISQKAQHNPAHAVSAGQPARARRA